MSPSPSPPLSDALIRALPKADLHVHLDGSLRLGTLIELARERKIELPSFAEEGLNELVFKPHYANLGEYLAGFQWTTAVMQDAEALERIAYEFALDNWAEGVRYVEARFAPQLHQHEHLDTRGVLAAVSRGMRRAEHEINSSVPAGTPAFRFGLIVCALRMFNEHFSTWYRQLLSVLCRAPRETVFGLASLELAREAVLARDEDGHPVVGFDLAGQEDGYPALDHVAAFDFAHRNFMHKTVHAGEAYGAESIFQATSALHADRIGHGYLLFSPDRITDASISDRGAYTRRLAQYLADRRVTMEVCVTSNLQTNPTIGTAAEHALRTMIDNRLSVALCTDNRLVSHTTVSNEIRVAVDCCGVTARELRDIVIHSFKRSFFPGSYLEKRAYVRQVIDYFDRVMISFSSPPAPN